MLKSLVERALLRSGVAHLASRRLPNHAALVLAYHNVVAHHDDQAGDSSLHLSRQSFAEQLDVLAAECDVVTLGEIMRQPARPGRRRRVAITFDDAYTGALEVGVPEVTRRGMPATVFVAPGLLGETTWWDMLAVDHGGVLPHELRERALWECTGLRASVLDRLPPEMNARPNLHRIATLEELGGVRDNGMIALGSHTWSHINLAAASRNDLSAELARPLEWLRARFSNVIPMLSYPYGLFAPHVEVATREAGYEAAFRVDGGWLRASTPQSAFAVPRFNVPAKLSLDGFRLRLAGIKAG